MADLTCRHGWAVHELVLWSDVPDNAFDAEEKPDFLTAHLNGPYPEPSPEQLKTTLFAWRFIEDDSGHDYSDECYATAEYGDIITNQNLVIMACSDGDECQGYGTFAIGDKYQALIERLPTMVWAREKLNDIDYRPCGGEPTGIKFHDLSVVGPDCGGEPIKEADDE